MPFHAKFPGFCDRCHEPFEKGAPVVRRRDGYIHEGCASGADDE